MLEYSDSHHACCCRVLSPSGGFGFCLRAQSGGTQQTIVPDWAPQPESGSLWEAGRGGTLRQTETIWHLGIMYQGNFRNACLEVLFWVFMTVQISSYLSPLSGAGAYLPTSSKQSSVLYNAQGQVRVLNFICTALNTSCADWSLDVPCRWSRQCGFMFLETVTGGFQNDGRNPQPWCQLLIWVMMCWKLAAIVYLAAFFSSVNLKMLIYTVSCYCVCFF